MQNQQDHMSDPYGTANPPKVSHTDFKSNQSNETPFMRMQNSSQNQTTSSPGVMAMAAAYSNSEKKSPYN
jgi:hypothetical protein